MKTAQKKYLKGLAHPLKPVVFIGQKGITETVIKEIDAALRAHELIKIRFLDEKEKKGKQALIEMIEERTACSFVGMIGHIAIFFRANPDPDKRKIRLPDTEKKS